MLERAPPPTTVPLEDIALQRGREVSNASARDCEDWGFQKAEMEGKEEEGLALAAACRLTK